MLLFTKPGPIRKKFHKNHNLIFTVVIFFYPFYMIFLIFCSEIFWKSKIKKSGTYIEKKHVHIWWKKSWSWLFFSPYVHDFVMLLFQEISKKIRLKKSCTTCEKKPIYLSWKSCIIFGVWAPIYLIRKNNIFLQKKYMDF